MENKTKTHKKILTLAVILLTALFLTAVVSATKINSKPTLQEGIEKSYYGDKFKQQNGFVISSKEVYAPEWFPDNHPLRDKAVVKAVYQIENTNTGEFFAIRQTFQVDKGSSGSWDLDLSKASWVTLKSGKVNSAYTWEQADNYISIDEIVSENETDKVIKTTKQFKDFTPITDKEMYKIVKLLGNSLTLDPDFSACGTISSAGYYTITTNLTHVAGSGCIVIASGNVTVDGNGTTLTGSGVASNYGITIATQNNINITNLNIQGFNRAMSFFIGTNLSIQGVKTYNISGIALRFSDLINTKLNNFSLDQSISASTSNVLTVSTTNNSLFSNGTILITQSTSPAGITTGGDGQIFEDILVNSTGIGVSTSGTGTNNVTFRRLNIWRLTTTSSHGMSFTSTDFNGEVSNTIIEGFQNGIRISGATNINLTDNTISRTGIAGIESASSPINSTIRGNTISNLPTGILFSVGGVNSLIYMNNISMMSATGIRKVGGEGYANISNNIINGTSVNGILLTNRNNTYIAHNQIYNTTQQGILLTSSNNNTIILGAMSDNRMSFLTITTSANNNRVSGLTSRVNSGITITSSNNNSFTTDSSLGWNASIVLGTLTFNYTTDYTKIRSTASGINNVTLTGLTNTLVHNGTAIFGSQDIASNDGNINMLNFDGTDNNIYALNNYNLTEGITRENNPINVSSLVDNSIKRFQTSLLTSISAQVLVVARDCAYPISSVFYDPNTNVSTQLAQSAYACDVATDRLSLDNLTINPAQGIAYNILTINYWGAEISPVCDGIFNSWETAAGFFGIIIAVGVCVFLIIMVLGGVMIAMNQDTSIAEGLMSKVSILPAIVVTLFIIGLLIFIFSIISAGMCAVGG